MALSFLAGKRVLVTGVGRGIGRAIALICHKHHGAQVAISSRTRSELEETADLAAKMSDSCSVEKHVVNMIKQSEAFSTIKSIVDKWGGLNILSNNAGGSQSKKGPVDSIESEERIRRFS